MRANRSCIEFLEARIAPAFAPVFELSSLSGPNGVKLNGVAMNDYSGHSVSDAGDVNGDGLDDVIIGARWADPHGERSGASYVVFGQRSAYPAALDLSTLNGSNGFTINGEQTVDYAGFSVSGAGDVNGDGFDDLLIGAMGSNNRTGATYVMFGKSTGFGSAFDLSGINGSNGFKMNGVNAGNYSGWSVSAAGDVNGDGFDDIVIGAYGAGGGATYVVFGRPAGFSAALNLSTLNGSNGFKISAESSGDAFGYSVSGAGDVNGDGFDDLVVGATRADPSGASYLVFGKAGGFAESLDASTLDGSNGFKMTSASDRPGVSVSGAGDVNSDGFDDLLIGGRGANVVFGKASGFTAVLDLSSLNGINGFRIAGPTVGDRFSGRVSGAGDIDGDGFDDLLIGADSADINGIDSGASYLVFGRAEGFAATLDASDLNGANGFAIHGVARGDHAGSSVSGAGDTNGDGFDDLLIGAQGAHTSGKSGAGATYIIFGRSNVPEIQINVADATVSEGDNGTTTLQFPVSLLKASNDSVSVEVRSVDGSAQGGSDYMTFHPQLLTFAPGETTKLVTIDLIGDTLYENNETFSLKLSNPTGATIGDGTGVGTIVNNDAPPVISIASASMLESDASVTNVFFTVSLSAASALPTSVSVASADGTAVTGSDYVTLISDRLTFAPGETMRTITINLLGDTSIEDNEQFSVILSNPSGSTIGVATATGTILNDDTAIRISDISALEGNAAATTFAFAVNLEKASALPVTVSYSAEERTASIGSDFVGASPDSQLVFAPGETTRMIVIEVAGDMEIEADETFSIVLSDATNALLAKGTGIGTIVNDDLPTLPPSRVRIDNGSVLEGHSGAGVLTFTVSLSAASAFPVSVNFTTVDGFARNGTDYTAPLSGSVDFAPGETSKTLAIDVRGDIAVEPSETFSIVLADASNAVIEDGTALGTILDDDVTLQGKRKATFSDVDGDRVTIKVNKGTLKVEDFTIVPSGSGAQLALIDFRDEAQFAGANLRITAKGVAGVASLVDVGHINATGIDLGKVVVKGDLGQIDAGNATDRKPGLLSLRANSLGLHGIETQLPGGSMQSDIVGALKTFQLLAGIHHATLLVSGSIGAVSVGGDWIASNLAAGATAGPDGFFGTEDDAPMPTPPSSSISRIASILIKGTASGTEGGTDHFGFVAAQVGAFAAGGSTVPLTRGANNDLTGLTVGASGDVTVREVAQVGV